MTTNPKDELSMDQLAVVAGGTKTIDSSIVKTFVNAVEAGFKAAQRLSGEVIV
jgi:hypothetical protein